MKKQQNKLTEDTHVRAIPHGSFGSFPRDGRGTPACGAFDFPGGAARHFPANYMPFAGAEIFVREHACVRAEIFFDHFLICGAEF